jgi:MoaA/NifB/PqqE/SkfB family radical SAM enzyme
MFAFDQLAQIQIEITSRCQASCPMCSRNVHGGLDNPLLPLNDWTLDNFKKIFNQDILNQISNINFAGSFGEPIVHSELIAMCQYIKDNSTDIHVTICTNGSARSLSWWEELARAMPQKHIVVFALDGLADTHSLYRIGTNFESIIENARAFISAGGNAAWQFIKFKHNQHQVNAARDMAKAIGFTEFKLKNSRRHGDPFKVLDRDGNVTHYLDASDEATIRIVRKDDFIKYKEWKNAETINCYAKKDKEIFIDAQYNMLPCCILPSFYYLDIDYNKEFYKEFDVYSAASHYDAGYRVRENFNQLIESLGGKEKLNLKNNSIRDIIDSLEWRTVWNNKWQNKESEVCIKFCSANSPFSSIESQNSDSNP